MPLLEIPSNFQLLWKPRENSATSFRNHHHVFLTRSGQAWIRETRLDGKHLAIFENNFLQTRMLVDFQAEAVTGSMKKSHPAPVTYFGRETATSEELLDGFMNCHAVNASLNSF